MTDPAAAIGTPAPTLVTFLLDRTGSMEICRDATIEAFNGYLGELRRDDTPILFTLLQFDSQSLDKVHFEKRPKDVPNLDHHTYVPRAGTPLVEAATKTIRALETAVGQKKEKPKVVVCIQTDGEENASSSEYTWEALKALIEARTKDGWQFNFMGAGIDAYAQSTRMGISQGGTISYDPTKRHTTRAAFAESARNASAYARGGRANTAFTMAQRASSGDAHAQRVFGGNGRASHDPFDLLALATQRTMSPPRPTNTGDGLDLTQ
jgi:hypothetical protein